MSVAFSRIIKAGNRQREFNFAQAYFGLDLYFIIDVVTDTGERISFKMNKNISGQWVILSPNLPAWIQDVNSELADTILEEVIQNNLPAVRHKPWYQLFQ